MPFEPVAVGYDLADLFLVHRLVVVRHAFRQLIVEYYAAYCCFLELAVYSNLYLGVLVHLVVLVGHYNFRRSAENAPLSHNAGQLLCKVVRPKYDILGGCRNRPSVRRGKYIIRGVHYYTRFHLGFHRKRHVHGHLVPVEVGVESRADKGMQPYGLTLYKLGLKSLDTQAVECRRAVEEHRMLPYDVVKDIPYFGVFLLDHFLRAFYRMNETFLPEFPYYKRLIKFERHYLGKPALVYFKFRAHHYYATSRIIYTFSEKVLAETPLFSFKHVREGFKRPAPRPEDFPAVPAVIEERVHSFLEHPFLVTHNNFRSLQLQQFLKPVVPVDHPSVKVVEVACREAPTVKRDKRTEVRRYNRYRIQYHPLGFVAAFPERIHYFQPFCQSFLGIKVFLLMHFRHELFYYPVHIGLLQKFSHGFRAHHGLELGAVFFAGLQVLVFRKHFLGF